MNNLKLNLDKTGVMLIGNVEILKDIALSNFNKVLADLVKSLGVILDSVLLLEKHVNETTKIFFPTHSCPHDDPWLGKNDLATWSHSAILL